MLPSTGYFKGLSCPFYDSGLCERPYCHFRHVKKEPQNNDAIESGTILQKLVSAAVQKVLQQTEGSSPSQSLVPEVTAKSSNIDQPVTSKATYNPTPISQLNKINNLDLENSEDVNEQRKRHIPVPYTPRKPASLTIKRPVETNGSFKPFIYIPPPAVYTPGCADNAQLDPYMPKGAVESKDKYLPGKEAELQQYLPDETHTSMKRNYVPSDKNVNKKVLEYKPVKVNAKSELGKITYQPTPRSLAPCFSSDEEEEPKDKKIKLSNDLNGLDDLGPEFDILDQILDDETVNNDNTLKVKKNEKSPESKTDKENKKKVDKKRDKERHEKERSKTDKHKSDKKEKSKSNEKHSKDKISSSKEPEKNSNHRSSGKDKDKSDSRRKSHSKSSHKSSSSKSSDSNSKHSKYSKEDSKQKSNSHKEHHKSHKNSKPSKEKYKEKKKDKESNQDTLEEQLLELSESDEESIALECMKIFKEYVPVEKPKYVEEVNQNGDDQDTDEYVPGKKRISRTAEKNITIAPKPQAKPNFKVNAAQAMADRLAKIREFHASKIQPSEVTDSQKVTTFTPPVSGNSKIRIAHVPYASTLLNAKKTMSNSKPNASDNNNVGPSTSSTLIQTVKKGAQRVAHMPNEKFIDRPGVLEPLASKIPANIRSIYLNMMIDECLKIYLLPVDAYARAQHEELTTSKKCSTIQIYKNSAVLTVSRLRKELQECNGVKKSGSDCTSLQKVPKAVSGTTGSAGSWSIENKHRKSLIDVVNLSGEKFYKSIQKWILTEEQLQENGFPRPHSSGEKGRAIIYGQKKQNPPKGYLRTCCRCKKDYTVNKKGFPSINEECIYHPNRKYRIRGEVKYQCCSQDGMSDGCCVASCHVYEYVDYENLKGYIRTLPPEVEKIDYGVYSLDCEMCYTTHGLDLTRVTVIDSSCKTVYETLVKPFHPIIDYNTRYSGITEEQMMGVNTSLLDVQATLLTMFSSKTILIGHSLESDFKALKLIHDTVIDTSVLFPHKMGPPYKRALRNLSSEHLKKIIQNSVEGHDSAEDATVCMELLLYKLKEDLKTR